MKISIFGNTSLYSITQRFLLVSSFYSPVPTIKSHPLDITAFNTPVDKCCCNRSDKNVCHSFQSLIRTLPNLSKTTTTTTRKLPVVRILIMSQTLHSKNSNQEENEQLTTMIHAAREQKKILRKKIRHLLRTMSNEEIQTQSQKVWNRLYNLSEYQNAKSIGLFLSMPSNEINTDSVVRQVMRDGKQLFIPRVGLDFEKCDMDMIRVPDINVVQNDSMTSIFHDNWPRNKWNIPEPPNNENEHVAGPGDIDLLIVPGVAFDKNGGRLGQGKGYYDRFIARVRVENNDNKEGNYYTPKLVAVGMEPQFLNEELVPVLEHDFQMDIVLTPDLTHTL